MIQAPGAIGELLLLAALLGGAGEDEGPRQGARHPFELDASREPELQLAMRDHLFQWLEERRRNPLIEPGEDVVADTEMLERLKALGYVK